MHGCLQNKQNLLPVFSSLLCNPLPEWFRVWKSFEQNFCINLLERKLISTAIDTGN